MSLKLESTAKINWFLQILGKRPDGFHAVRTLMLPIELADSMEFEELPEPKIELRCSDPTLPTDDHNLVCRAAKLLQTRHAPTRGARIHIEKRIPIGAGLGGGSSNGSTALVGLNRLWKLALPGISLEKLSAEFGSDTAFFVENQPALSEGRGEIMTPLPFPFALPILLVNFGFGSATAWAYRHLAPRSDAVTREDLLLPIRSAVDAAAQGEAFVLPTPAFQNDLETPVFAKFPVLEIAKEFLSSRPEVAATMMCGSGSTMLAVLRDLTQGEALRQEILKRFGNVWTWVGKTIPSRT